MQLSAIARHVGLLALEEETINNDSLSTMTKELLLLVVDGTESNLVARIGCMQYFATKKDAYQAISDIISIYGVLSIQAGDNPRVIKKMMNAMLPADVAVYESNSTYEVYCDYAFSSETDKKITEIDWASLYQGDICLKSSDKGYFEIKMLDSIVRQLDNRAIQRILRDVSDSSVNSILGVVSGNVREKILSNMSKNIASEMAARIDIGNTQYYDYQLEHIRECAINILKLINKLSASAEIVIAGADEAIFLTPIVEMLDEKALVEKTFKDKCDSMIDILKLYKKNI